jgi:hypothetical protein
MMVGLWRGVAHWQAVPEISGKTPPAACVAMMGALHVTEPKVNNFTNLCRREHT